MKRIYLFFLLNSLFLCTFAQSAKNICINEVLTNNSSSIIDDYGNHLPWVEIVNNSFSTYDVRGMYITTNKGALNKNLSVPERIKLMAQIPNGSSKTNLSGREHLLFYLNAKPSLGDNYLDTKVVGDSTIWIAIYDGNAIDIIDSISIPVLNKDCSFAREKDGSPNWIVKQPEFVSPGIANISNASESKIAKLKREDPHGFGITLLSMGVVFFCLALLYASFYILGIIMRRAPKIVDVEIQNSKVEAFTKKEAQLAAEEENESLQKQPTIEVAAVIAQAIKDYQDDVHVEESGIITLKKKQSQWK